MAKKIVIKNTWLYLVFKWFLLNWLGFSVCESWWAKQKVKFKGNHIWGFSSKFCLMVKSRFSASHTCRKCNLNISAYKMILGASVFEWWHGFTLSNHLRNILVLLSREGFVWFYESEVKCVSNFPTGTEESWIQTNSI